MFVRRIGFSLSLALTGAAVLVALVGWTGAQAAGADRAVESAIQQTMPMTETMPMTGTMPMNHAMPETPATGQGGMGAMMANMAEMQKMMARMQRMMAGGMMDGAMPMSGTMPMAGMMGGDMGEMMDMMAEMQGMMAEMQGMMAGEMMAGGMPMGGQQQGGMMGGQMQGQQMQGGMMGGQTQGGMGMMGQMPMMGTVIIVAPMPMGGMMQQGGMGMMGQMPMMQGMMSGGMMSGGMDMGSMMGGGMMGQGADSGRPEMAGPAAAAAGSDEQSGKLGAIDVKVTPPDLSNVQGDTIDFTVDLNATGADLGLDLAALATLKIGDRETPATAWTVEFDHGHHVKGALSFPADKAGAVESATLTLTDPAGGAALSLTWPAAE